MYSCIYCRQKNNWKIVSHWKTSLNLFRWRENKMCEGRDVRKGVVSPPLTHVRKSFAETCLEKWIEVSTTFPVVPVKSAERQRNVFPDKIVECKFDPQYFFKSICDTDFRLLGPFLDNYMDIFFMQM